MGSWNMSHLAQCVRDGHQGPVLTAAAVMAQVPAIPLLLCSLFICSVSAFAAAAKL